MVFVKKTACQHEMSNFERKYSPGYRHMTCIGKKNRQAKKVYSEVQHAPHEAQPTISLYTRQKPSD